MSRSRRSLRPGPAIVRPRGAGILAVGVILSLVVPAGWAAAAPTPAPARPTNVPESVRSGAGDSLDWAGFAATGSIVTAAGGSWTQPTAVCTGKKATQAAFWVGIDGYLSTDPTVQQVGTDADCTKATKKVPSAPSYYAWYELYPDAIVVLPTATHPVASGDTIDGAVSESGATVTLTITDVGRWTYSTVQLAPSVPLGESAEWIAEAPSVCKSTKCTAVPLTDFGSVAFTGATADGLPVDAPAFTDQEITMTKNKKGTIVKASTSALSGGGDFTVTWVSS